jgi:hypothetical protein
MLMAIRAICVSFRCVTERDTFIELELTFIFCFLTAFGALTAFGCARFAAGASMKVNISTPRDLSRFDIVAVADENCYASDLLPR